MAAPIGRSSILAHATIFSSFSKYKIPVSYYLIQRNAGFQGRRPGSDGHKYHRIEDPSLDEEFRILTIPGFSELDRGDGRQSFVKKPTPPPRTASMKPDQDWTNVWPAAETFKWSVVPLPVRQGAVDRVIENKGIPPAKHANPELMKIPNFLHLTPRHIKKHCAAIKKFCTKWPSGLETDEQCERHFPVTTVTSDFVSDGPSVRDPRARKVELQIKLSSLELDYHARDKLMRLVGPRYDSKTDTLAVVADRCPLKTQNKDYAMYLLTALFYESWKVEPWEAEKTVLDMEKYVWDQQQSRKCVIAIVQNIIEKVKSKDQENNDIKASYVQDLPDEASEEDIIKAKPVEHFKEAIEQLHNEGESLHALEKYKDAARQIYNLPKLGEMEFPPEY